MHQDPIHTRTPTTSTTTLIYLIAEQDVLSEQALNSKIHPACFLFTVYVVPNNRAGTKQQILTSLLAACLAIRYIRVVNQTQVFFEHGKFFKLLKVFQVEDSNNPRGTNFLGLFLKIWKQLDSD